MAYRRFWGYLCGVTLCLLATSLAFAEVVKKETVPPHDAVVLALDQLMQGAHWQTALQVVRRHIGLMAPHAVFYEKAILIFAQQGHYDEALSLAALAQSLFPDHVPFYRHQAQLLARQGACAKASPLWQIYLRKAYFPVAIAEQEAFAYYCGIDTKSQLIPSIGLSRDERLAAPFGKSTVIAEDHSLLSEFCALQISLCPADNRFQLEEPPPPRNTALIGLTSQIEKRYSWRHLARVNLSAGQHFGGYGKRNAGLSAQLDWRLSPERTIIYGLGLREILIPAYQRYPAYLARTAYLSWQHIHQLPHNVVSLSHLYHDAAQSVQENFFRTTHQTIVENQFDWQSSPAQKWQVRLSTAVIRPPHDDAHGGQIRYALGAGYQRRLIAGYLMEVDYDLSHHHVSKTLPFLSKPHRIVEKRYFFRMSKPFGGEKRVIPFVSLTHIMRRSDNPQQQGKKSYITAGLSFRY